MLTPTQIKPGIWWVGAVDWNARLFHGYTTERGITYNAYLVVDEKVALIDCVKRPFARDLIDRVSQVIDPSKIDVIVVNHTEMDHSGALPLVRELCPNATVYASAPNGERIVHAHYGDDLPVVGVKTGDSISLGSRTLSFVQTPMVHWPDNMVTYCPEDKVLFSNDAFGQHFASSQRFDDENDIHEVMVQAKKYYANIVQPYALQARKALAAVHGLGQDALDIIAPAHGVIWRSHVADILAAYDGFVSGEVREKALVVYDTMWSSTERIAKAIAEAFVEQGVECHLTSLQATHESDIMTDFLDARYLCVGSPTLNSQMLPTVASFLTYLRGLSPKDGQRIAVAFGSYGWAPLGPKSVAAQLAEAGFQMPVETIATSWVPSQAFLDDAQAKVRSMIAAASVGE